MSDRVCELPAETQAGDWVIARVPVWEGEKLRPPAGWRYIYTHIEDGQRYDTFSHCLTPDESYVVTFTVEEE
jgi:hypothetical protein